MSEMDISASTEAAGNGCADAAASDDGAPRSGREGSSSIRLSPALDLLAANDLRQSLLASLQERAPIVLDGIDVGSLSTPCAQILIAAARSAEAAGVAFRLENASPELLAALDDLGLHGALAKWMI